MKLLDRSGWKTDEFLRSEDVSAGEAMLVPLSQAEAALAGPAPGRRIGALVPNTTQASSLKPIQDGLALIAIDFPATGDGRGFSLARGLRDQGYQGLLRATGALIPDQFAFALSCGFDEVEIDDARAARQPIGQWLGALASISVHYQGRGSIFAARRAAAS